MILDIICVMIADIAYRIDTTVHITELQPGDTVRLLDFGKTPPHYRHRLLALGLTRGVTLSVVRVAPLGCPMQIRVRGTNLTLRLNEALHIQWEYV